MKFVVSALLILATCFMIPGCPPVAPGTQPAINPALTNFVILLAAQDGLAMEFKSGNITADQYKQGTAIVADANRLAGDPTLTPAQQQTILLDAVTKVNNLFFPVPNVALRAKHPHR